MTLYVIYNPEAARGRMRVGLERLRRKYAGRAVFLPSRRPGHAEELALAAATSGADVVAAAGGDGTVHDVANGILRSGRDDVALRVLPLGSANDFAHALQFQADLGQPVRRADVGLARADDGRERFFVNSLGVGFNGAVAIESRSIRSLRGLPLYGLAFLKALWRRFAHPSMTISLDRLERTVPTLSLTLALGRREGNFVVAPHALLDDGWFDHLHVGPLSRSEVLRCLLRLAAGKSLPTDHPLIWMGLCRQVRIQSADPLLVHLDGEFFCLPHERIHEMEVRLLPGRLPIATSDSLA